MTLLINIRFPPGSCSHTHPHAIYVSLWSAYESCTGHVLRAETMSFTSLRTGCSDQLISSLAVHLCYPWSYLTSHDVNFHWCFSLHFWLLVMLSNSSYTCWSSRSFPSQELFIHIFCHFHFFVFSPSIS